MAYNADTREFNPDKKFLQNICKKATCQADAARLCGISTKTFIRRMKEAKLSRELKELVKQGKAMGRKSWDPDAEGSLAKKKSAKKRTTKRKSSAPSPLLEAAKALHEKKVGDQVSPKPIQRTGERMAILDEIAEAKKEQAAVPPPKEKQEEDFFGDLASKLSHLDNGEQAPPSPTTPKVEIKPTSKRERCLPTLIRIANMLLDECDA